MIKDDYLQTLRAHLAQMPQEERERQMAYYEELFDDMLEDGMSEAEVVEKLGDPAVVAQELLSQLPLSTLVKTRVRPQGGWTAMTLVLLILGSPVWLPLAVAFASVVLAVVISLWAVVFSLAVTVLALGASAIFMAASVFTGWLSAPPLIKLGLALVAGGCAILAALLVWKLAIWMSQLCALIWKWLKSLFIRREV